MSHSDIPDNNPVPGQSGSGAGLPTADQLIDDLNRLLLPAWHRRVAILAFAFGVAVVSAGITLLVDDRFVSTATIMPQQEQSLMSSSALGNLASLAGLTGSQSSLTELYPALFVSESIVGEVLKCRFYTAEIDTGFMLPELWEIETVAANARFEAGFREFVKYLEIEEDRKSSILTVMLEAEDPALAAAILDTLFRKTDEFIRTRQTSFAREQRKWIDARLKEVSTDLSASEDSLKRFREQNRRIVDSPDLLLQQERLTRNVLINGTLYTELRKQFEMVRIEEIKSIPILNILDPPRPPARKSFPRRGMIAVIAAFLAVFIGTGYAVAGSHLKRHLSRFVSGFDLEAERRLWTDLRTRFGRRRS